MTQSITCDDLHKVWLGIWFLFLFAAGIFIYLVYRDVETEKRIDRLEGTK